MIYRKIPAFPISKQWLRDAATLAQKSSVAPIATGPPKDDIFSPRNFNEYIGQERAKDICQIIVDSANMEQRSIPSILIYGPYGLGKTTLAKLIMERHKHPYRVIDASGVARIESMKGHVIIEEIHNLPAEVCDQLNIQMDAGKLTIVGSTTHPGSLPSAFRSRFRPISLENYTEKDIEVILKNSLKRKGIKFVGKSLSELAKRSRCNPRHALQILSFTLELTTILNHATLTIDTVYKALEKLDIDDRGLTSIDRKYLTMLSAIKPIGLQQICAVLGTNAETVENEIEPFLLQQGLIERTPRGRLLSEGVFDADLEQMLKDSLEIINKKHEVLS